MRTISQLIFETLPQIFLQVRILLYFRDAIGGSAVLDDDVFVETGILTIIISILFAITHGVLEFTALYIEAKVFNQYFLEYFVVGFNGQLMWAPRANLIKDKEYIASITGEGNYLEYDNLSGVICG